ncbi:DNase I-like protein [Ramicandelaber brevisporus]|nr:DNase I-like protein [Ramicandelaber brevisporus]
MTFSALELVVRIGTLNAGCIPPTADLADWLCPPLLRPSPDSSSDSSSSISSKSRPLPDILAVGFQEFEPNDESLLHTAAQASSPVSLLATDPAVAAVGKLIEDALVYAASSRQMSERSRSKLIKKATSAYPSLFKDESDLDAIGNVTYEPVVVVRHVAMVLYVYTRVGIGHLSGISWDHVGCGLGGVMGNKGAVAARLDIIAPWLTTTAATTAASATTVATATASDNHTIVTNNDEKQTVNDSNLDRISLVFVNAHLAAHNFALKRRNQDYHQILSQMSFSIKDNLSQSSCRTLGILNHDLVYFFGDLNYRVDLKNHGLAKLPISSQLHRVMRHYDQLDGERASGRILVDFNEAVINFPPTFKFEVGSTEVYSSKKDRIPSWTDRVLYKTASKGSVKVRVIDYLTHIQYIESDHKPVSATFKVTRVPSPQPEEGDDGEQSRSLPVANREGNKLDPRRRLRKAAGIILDLSVGYGMKHVWIHLARHPYWAGAIGAALSSLLYLYLFYHSANAHQSL